MIRRPPRSTQSRSSAASDVYKRQATRLRDLTTQPQRRNQGPEVEDPDRPATHSRPNQKRRTSDPIRPHRNKTRWIEVESSIVVIVTAWQVGAVGTELGKYLAPSTGPFESRRSTAQW